VDVTSPDPVSHELDAASWAADPAELAESLRRWHEAEGRVYQLVLTSPELYELSLVLVRAVADELGGVVSEAGLVRSYAGAGEVVERVAAARGVDVGRVDVGAVAGAGFCLRHGELVAAHAQQAARRRVEEARAAGRTWATLHESGTLPEPGGFGVGYHVIEASLEVPWGVHGSATFDLETGSMVYLVEPVAVDVGEASWWIPDEAPVAERTCGDVDTWRAALAEMRTELSELS
jgi:hypothetical protein